MKLNAKLAVIPAVLALAAAPALAVADPPTDHPKGPPSTVTTGKPSDKPATPGPKASLPAKAKAYGVYCRGESKKHVKGEKGTPFSQCVTAMAKLAKGKTNNARTACKGESKKHVKGQKGTPFSQCVSAAAKLKADRSSGSDDDDSSSTSSS